MSAFGTGTLFAPSHMESRSIAGVVLSALAAAALAGYAGFGFYDKQYGISSLAVAAMLMCVVLAVVYAKYCNCAAMMRYYALRVIKTGNTKPSNPRMIVVVTISTLACAVALAGAVWGAVTRNYVAAGVLGLAFAMLLTSSITAGLWLAFTQENMDWCAGKMSAAAQQQFSNNLLWDLYQNGAITRDEYDQNRTA